MLRWLVYLACRMQFWGLFCVARARFLTKLAQLAWIWFWFCSSNSDSDSDSDFDFDSVSNSDSNSIPNVIWNLLKLTLKQTLFPLLSLRFEARKMDNQPPEARNEKRGKREEVKRRQEEGATRWKLQLTLFGSQICSLEMWIRRQAKFPTCKHTKYSRHLLCRRRFSFVV